MVFGEAIEYMKGGCRAWRDGWNGKGMYVAFQPGSTISNENARGGAALALAKERPGDIVIRGHFDMRTAQGDIQVGWLASQSDMLADDWIVSSE